MCGQIYCTSGTTLSWKTLPSLLLFSGFCPTHGNSFGSTETLHILCEQQSKIRNKRMVLLILRTASIIKYQIASKNSAWSCLFLFFRVRADVTHTLVALFCGFCMCDFSLLKWISLQLNLRFHVELLPLNTYQKSLWSIPLCIVWLGANSCSMKHFGISQLHYHQDLCETLCHVSAWLLIDDWLEVNSFSLSFQHTDKISNVFIKTNIT